MRICSPEQRQVCSESPTNAPDRPNLHLPCTFSGRGWVHLQIFQSWYADVRGFLDNVNAANKVEAMLCQSHQILTSRPWCTVVHRNGIRGDMPCETIDQQGRTMRRWIVQSPIEDLNFHTGIQTYIQNVGRSRYPRTPVYLCQKLPKYLTLSIPQGNHHMQKGWASLGPALLTMRNHS